MKLCRNVYNNGVMYHAHEPQLWLTSWIICPCINFRFTLYLLNRWKYFNKTLWWCVYCQGKVLRLRVYELSPLFDFGVSQLLSCFTLEPDFWCTNSIWCVVLITLQSLITELFPLFCLPVHPSINNLVHSVTPSWHWNGSGGGVGAYN